VKSLVALQTDILEKVAYGEPLASVADHLCRQTETITPDAVCSVLTVDREGRLRALAGPSLPERYSRAISGIPVGPDVGCCGSAAYHGVAVEVTDIECDPLFDNYRRLVLPLGLKACWSSPIKARDGRVVGTFAFYFPTCRGPTDVEREVVARCTHLCSIAIEHDEIRRRMHELAFVDTLSKAPNRASFNLRINQLTEANSKPFALLLIDLDHLKEINDTLGHAGGDMLVRTTAERLKTAPIAVEAFRIGGDEFAVVVPSCSTASQMAKAAKDLIEAVSMPFQYGEHTIASSVTVGGALYGCDGTDAETLYQNADFALYHAKAEFRGGFIPFVNGMRTAITRRIETIREIGDALSDGRVFATYQPIVRINTAEIVGVEALVRMRTPEGRIVPASEFHDAISDPRIGDNLTMRMLSEVTADVRTWLDNGISLQHVGINVASPDFQKGDLANRILQNFAEVDVPLEHIILEINETVFMGGRDNHIARAAENLRTKGMRVALDDFGTGHASLTHLLNFPVDIIKIDKSFVARMIEDHRSLVIVEGLIETAHKLDMQIIAEGIETEEQADKLASLGCTLGQGYRFGHAASAATTFELLRRFSRNPDRPATYEVPYRLSA
jgi:diguanylate cyclase (GGDEF)-like protein